MSNPVLTGLAARSLFTRSLSALSLSALSLAAAPQAQAQTVLTGDHSVDGNLCVGPQCTGSESFGNYPLRLKGDVLGIDFVDTSNPTTTPSQDWRLQINDSHAAGQNSISILDATTGLRVFKIEGYAPQNAFYMDDEGSVGLGSSLPMGNLHIARGDTPNIYFEQNGTGGYDPQAWSMLANEIHFALVDETNSVTPVMIEPGTGNDLALYIAGNGRLGFGTGAPAAALHLARTDGSAQMLVQETSASISPRTLLNLQNNGRPEIVMGNSSTGEEWSFGAGTNFVLKQGSVGSDSSVKTKLFEIKANGDAVLAGSLTTGGPSCGAGCDAVFADHYDLPSISEHAEAMFALGYLPNVGPTAPDRPVNVTDHLGRVLNELEHAHIYIVQQEDRIARLEALVGELLAERD